MFGRTDTEHHIHTTEAVRARGGVSFGPIITGVLVALGAMFLLSAIVAGVLASLGTLDEITAGEAVQAGLGAGIALVVAQLLAYLWGGYTAGRMSRGAGVANGLLVPLSAILLALAVGAIAALLGAETNLNLPFAQGRLPLESDLLVEWGVPIGIASLVAMFLGGALGGALGARWHTKLERGVAEEVEGKRIEHDRTLRHDHAQTTPPPAPPAESSTSTIRTEDGRPVRLGGAAAESDQTVDLREEQHTHRGA